MPSLSSTGKHTIRAQFQLSFVQNGQLRVSRLEIPLLVPKHSGGPWSCACNLEYREYRLKAQFMNSYGNRPGFINMVHCVRCRWREECSFQLRCGLSPWILDGWRAGPTGEWRLIPSEWWLSPEWRLGYSLFIEEKGPLIIEGRHNDIKHNRIVLFTALYDDFKEPSFSRKLRLRRPIMKPMQKKPPVKHNGGMPRHGNRRRPLRFIS